MSLTNNLLATRRAVGKTQQQVAQTSGMNVTQYNGYERGRSRPTRAVLARIAAALNTTPDALLGIAEPTPASAIDLSYLRQLKAEYQEKVAIALGVPPANVVVQIELTA